MEETYNPKGENLFDELDVMVKRDNNSSNLNNKGTPTTTENASMKINNSTDQVQYESAAYYNKFAVDDDDK